ncbi:MAG: IS4 family transposase, partial [Pseudobdellovibrionaceae bacterium]
MEPIKFHLCDSRLEERTLKVSQKLSSHPDLSFPNIFEEPSELEGFYRLLNNPRVSYEQMREDLIKNTLAKVTDFQEVLALHDTTQMALSEKAKKISSFQGCRGFLAHMSLLVSAENCREVLGIGGLHTWSRDFEKQTQKSSERLCWLNNVQELEEKNAGLCRLIHVMDREGDIFYVWSWIKNHHAGCVIRAHANRRIMLGKHLTNMFDEIRKLSPVARRKIKLAKRVPRLPSAKQKHPSREEREIEVSISASPVDICVMNPKNNRLMGEIISMNLVRVYEEPNKKIPPKDLMEWMLLTTEPIGKPEEVLRVVDIYRARWVIEEFFKGLKTGCHYEDRQLQDAQAWYKLLVLFLPVTAHILNLRNLSE